MFVFLVLLLPPSFAGKPLPDHVRKRLTKECNSSKDGDSCVELAKETLCGMGYNDEYAQLMTKACTVFQKNCKEDTKSSIQACTNYAQCLLDCSDLETDSPISMTMNNTGQRHCFLPKEKQNSLSKGLQLLEKTCAANSVYGCLSSVQIHAQTKPNRTRQNELLRKACALNDAEGCTMLIDALQTEQDETREKACELGAAEYCVEK